MARKKKPEKEANHERWLVSYADFITLLFAVFVTLYAMGQVDKQKVEQVIASLQESFGTSKLGSATRPSVMPTTEMRIMPSLKPSLIGADRRAQNTGHGGRRNKGRAEEKDFREMKTAIEAFLAKSGAQDKVGVEITRRGLVVSLRETGFFDSGSALVKESSYPLLSKLAESLSDYENGVRVEGHTDNMPISSAAFPSNWELSTARATSIVHYLTRAEGFDPQKISAAGYGEYRPISENMTPEGRGKNRRVDIVLLSEDSERMEP